MAPPSLKDIRNTDADPNLCAVCSEPFPSGLDYEVNMCCGREACGPCNGDGSLHDSRTDRCILCQSAPVGSIGLLKKQAKSGHPWAQYTLGLAFANDLTGSRTHYSVSPDAFEAVRWYRKAERRGHPLAAYRLAHCYRTGSGCKKDLFQAKKTAEKALNVNGGLKDEVRDVLLQIGKELVKICINMDVQMEEALAALDEAELILVPLAKVGMPAAQLELGKLILCRGVPYPNSRSMELFEAAAAVGHTGTLLFCFDFSWRRSRYPEARFWLRGIKAWKQRCTKLDLSDYGENMATLRELRTFCKGCGIGLDGATRKMCKGCKAYCYCSSKCQKLHWNMPGKDGHRGECLEVTELNERMRQLMNT